MSFLENLNWRYATKKYDTTKKISEEDIQKIKNAIRMAPFSFGFQMYSVLDIVDKDLREKMKEIGYNQSQITDADRLFVFCGRDDNENRLEEMFSDLSGGDDTIRNNNLKNYEDSIRGVMDSRSKEEILNWSIKNSYIALGFGLAACAELKIDSSPMEGFDAKKLKEVLNLDSHLYPAVILAIGYRDENDEHLKLPKWRFEEGKIFSKV